MSPLPRLIELKKNARNFGFEWPDAFMILDQIVDECREVREELLLASHNKLQEEVGDLLHAAFSLCLFLNLDLEETLSKTNDKFEKRMLALKNLTQDSGLSNLKGQSLEFMLNLWREAKKQ